MADKAPKELTAANYAVIRKALDEAMAGAFGHIDPAKVPSDIPLKDNCKMPADVNGIAQVNSRIDGIEQTLNTSILSLSDKIDTKFNEIITRSDNKQAELAANLTRQIADSRPDINRYTGIASLIVVVAVAGVGGFFGYVKGTLETDITRGERTTERLNENILKLSNSTLVRFDRLQDNTMPKEEVLLRTERNTTDVKTKLGTDVFDATIEPLKEDVAKLQKDIVSRAEHQQEMQATQDALTRISTHLAETDRRVEGFMLRTITPTPVKPATP